MTARSVATLVRSSALWQPAALFFVLAGVWIAVAYAGYERDQRQRLDDQTQRIVDWLDEALAMRSNRLESWTAQALSGPLLRRQLDSDPLVTAIIQTNRNANVVRLVGAQGELPSAGSHPALARALSTNTVAIDGPFNDAALSETPLLGMAKRLDADVAIELVIPIDGLRQRIDAFAAELPWRILDSNGAPIVTSTSTSQSLVAAASLRTQNYWQVQSLADNQRRLPYLLPHLLAALSAALMLTILSALLDRRRWQPLQAWLTKTADALLEGEDIEQLPAPNTGAPTEVQAIAKAMANTLTEVVARRERLQQTVDSMESLVEERSQAAAEAGERLTRLLNSIPAMIWSIDFDGRIRYANKLAAQEMHTSEQSLRGERIERFIAAQSRQAWSEAMASVVQDLDRRATINVSLQLPDDSLLPVEVSIAVDLPDAGEAQMRVVMIDRTEMSEAEAELDRQQAILSQFARNTPMAITMLDQRLRTLVVSQAFRQLLGKPDETALGQSIIKMLSAQVKNWLPAIEQSWKTREPRRAEGLVVGNDGERRWLRCDIHPWRSEIDVRLAGLFLVVSDLTQQRLQAADLQRQATLDRLTGLRNRASFLDHVGKLINNQRESCALMALDLVGFRQINQRYGHEAGDKVLRHIADTLRASTTPNEVCARFSADEFAVVLRDVAEPADLAQRAEQVQEAILQPIEIDGKTLIVPVRIGVVPIDATFSVEVNLARAEAAMA